MSLLPAFKAIEATGFAIAINNSKYDFALLECFHILALAIIGGSVLMVDLRLLGIGFRNQPVASVATATRPWLIGSLIVILTTGFFMFSSLAASKYYYNAAYWYKMYFLLAAIFFTFAVRQPFAMRESTRVPSAIAKIVAVVSIFLWVTVAAMGRAIGFI